MLTQQVSYRLATQRTAVRDNGERPLSFYRRLAVGQHLVCEVAVVPVMHIAIAGPVASSILCLDRCC